MVSTLRGGSVPAQVQPMSAKVVFTNGCFDLLHAGHVSLLTRARKLGDRLIVGLNSDNSIRRLKGQNRPIYPLPQRLEMLNALKVVDEVRVFDDETPHRLIMELKPDILVKGAEGQSSVVGQTEMATWGGIVLYLPFFEDISTSKIIARIQTMNAGDMEAGKVPQFECTHPQFQYTHPPVIST